MELSGAEYRYSQRAADLAGRVVDPEPTPDWLTGIDPITEFVAGLIVSPIPRAEITVPSTKLPIISVHG